MSSLQKMDSNVIQALAVTGIPEPPAALAEGGNIEKFPLKNLSALGVAFEPLTSAIQTILGEGGGSGFYFVNTHGGVMHHFKESSSYLGAIKAANGGVGGGQAALTQLPCSPTMLFMSAALMNIEKKLDSIEKLQEEMLDYMKAQERAKLAGSLDSLNGALRDYKFNWDNESFKSAKLSMIQGIITSSASSINLCREQIEKQLAKKQLFHGDKDVQTRLKAITGEFSNYRLALYLNAFSAFMEVLLTGNFSAEYIANVISALEDKSASLRELYTKCSYELENYTSSTVKSALTRGVAAAGRTAGKAIAKIPILKKGPVDEVLISAGDRFERLSADRTDSVILTLATNVGRITTPFKDNLLALDRAFNHPAQVFFDAENIYFIE